jgi:HlyD family secretion protein
MSRLTKIAVWTTVLAGCGLAAGLAQTGRLPLLKKPGTPEAPLQSAASEAKTAALAAAVSVDIVGTEKFADALLVTGTLVPREEILVGPEVEGLRIIEVLADEGDKVKKGQVLARLASDTLDAQLAQNDASQAKATAAIAQAKSNLASAEAKLVETRNAYDRGKPLRGSGVISESVQDQRESAFKSAQAALGASQDAIKLAEADRAQVIAMRRELDWRRSRTSIMAPADGIISRRIARVGGFGAGSGDAMFRIIANGQIEMEAEVPETRLARLREGQNVAMDVPGAPGLKGKVRLVSPEVDKASRLGRIRILVDDNPALRIGAFTRGVVTLETSNGLGVPSSAIQYADTGPTVQVVKDGKVEVRSVTLGLSSGARTEVKTGLVEKEMVVSRSGTFLRHGDAVRPILQNRTEASAADRKVTP